MWVKGRPLIPGLILVTTLAIFLLDLILPLGYAVPLLYFLPLWVTLSFPGAAPTLGVAAFQGGLVVLGFFLSPPGPVGLALANRFMAISVMAVSVCLLLRLKKSQAEIAERKGIEAGLRAQAETLHALREGMARLTDEPEKDRIFQGILETARELTGARYGALGVFDETGKRMIRFVTSGMDEATQRAIGTLPTNRGLLGAIKATDGVIRLRDLSLHPASIGFPPHHPPMRSLIGTTLHAYGRYYGWLYLTEKIGEDEFSERDGEILAALAVHAAAVLENFRRLEQLLHAEKLGAIGKLSASIAHEFNNPIYGIRNVLEQVREKSDGDPRWGELVKLAVGECNRMADLVRNLGDFYRPTPGNWVLTSLHCILDNTLLLMGAKLHHRGIRVVRGYADDLPMIGTIPDQIRQVILNLLMNAEEAIQEKGGTITVTTEKAEDRVRLKIGDSGVGIPAEMMDSLCEPFLTTKSDARGSGLGLSVSRGIVKRHGGEIAFASRPGIGTTVTVTLPIEPSFPEESR